MYLGAKTTKAPPNLCTSPGQWKSKTAKQSSIAEENKKPASKQQQMLKQKL